MNEESSEEKQGSLAEDEVTEKPRKRARKTARKKASSAEVEPKVDAGDGERKPEKAEGKVAGESSADRTGPEEPSGSPSAPKASSGGSHRKGGGSKSQGGGSPSHSHQQGGANRQSRNKKKRKSKSGGGGGGIRRFAPYDAGGVPVELDPHLELGQLITDELLQDFEALEESYARIFDESEPTIRFNDLYDAPLQELRERGKRLALDLENAPSRPLILREMLKHFEAEKKPILVEGVLEIFDDGFGMVVFGEDSYRVKSLCPFVSEALIEHHGLQRGHTIEVLVQAPREGESCPVALKVRSVMGGEASDLEKITPFTELIPYYPLDRILLESPNPETENNLSMRVVDLITPIGFGQRGLIVAPPRTGKTVLLQAMAHSVQENYPGAHLIVLLIDERPEEVTDFRRRVNGEVISSTFDETAGSHVHAAEMVIEKARRMVEVGRDVVILLDSITRLARAYNTMMPNSGKILSGGVEANALQKPKRFFGSARNIEGGGSLTIMGTALVETGSKMDEVIFEEFKGTGNMELHLDRGLVDKRVFPALAMDRSGTRKEELLYHPDEMQKVYSLRRATKGVPPIEAMEMLIQRLKKTRSNAEFLMTLGR